VCSPFSSLEGKIERRGRSSRQTDTNTDGERERGKYTIINT